MVDEGLEEIKESLLPNFNLNRDERMNEITEEEIENNLKSTKKNSSPGDDGITFNMISQGGAKLITLLLILFNGILNSGHFPSKWKQAKI